MKEVKELSLYTTIDVVEAKTELQILAEQKTTEILRNIERVNQHIQEAKQQAIDASNMETGWFGKTGRKATKIAEALIITNESMNELNALIRESIKFTCSSTDFARVMFKTMSRLMITGFKDTNGNIIRLSGKTKDFANMILEEAEDFVRKQKAVEDNQERLDHAIDEQEARLDKIKKILEKKESIDEEQTKRLNLLSRLLDEKSSVDEKQEKSISLLFEYMEVKQGIDNKQQAEIDAMKLKITQLNLVVIVLSILGLMGAVTGIVLVVIK